MSHSLQLNCDLGESGLANPADYAILPHVHAINIALGGHAGDAATAHDLMQRAHDLGVQANLHPSYPDRAHFGRRVLSITESELCAALDQQRALLPEVVSCKFHGALYNQAVIGEGLARCLVAWSLRQGIEELITMPGGCLAKEAAAQGLRVLGEGFADRGYCVADGHLALQSRSQPGALLQTVEAVRQRLGDLQSGQVRLVDGSMHPLEVESVCIHGDGPHAVAFAQAAREALT